MYKVIKSNKLGIVLSMALLITGIFALGAYGTFASSFEASLAVGQLNDSIVEYSLIQKVIVGNLIPSVIIFITALLMTLFLAPLVKSILNESTKKKEDG